MDLLVVLGLLVLVLVEASAWGGRFSSIQLPLLPSLGAAPGTSGASALPVLLSRSRAALVTKPSICPLLPLLLPGASAAWNGERTKVVCIGSLGACALLLLLLLPGPARALRRQQVAIFAASCAVATRVLR
jgi:hypothetical protein